MVDNEHYSEICHDNKFVGDIIWIQYKVEKQYNRPYGYSTMGLIREVHEIYGKINEPANWSEIKKSRVLYATLKNPYKAVNGYSTPMEDCTLKLGVQMEAH